MKFLTPLFLILMCAGLTFATVTATAPYIQTENYKDFEIAITATETAGVAAGQFDIYFDPEVIVPVSDEGFCTTDGTISPFMVICNGHEAGRIRVTLFGSLPIVENEGTIVRLNFTTVNPGKTQLLFNIGSFWAFHPARELESSWVNGSVIVE